MTGHVGGQETPGPAQNTQHKHGKTRQDSGGCLQGRVLRFNNGFCLTLVNVGVLGSIVHSVIDIRQPEQDMHIVLFPRYFFTSPLSPVQCTHIPSACVAGTSM